MIRPRCLSDSIVARKVSISEFLHSLDPKRTLSGSKKRPQHGLRPCSVTNPISLSIPQARVHGPIERQLIEVLDVFERVERQLLYI